MEAAMAPLANTPDATETTAETVEAVTVPEVVAEDRAPRTTAIGRAATTARPTRIPPAAAIRSESARIAMVEAVETDDQRENGTATVVQADVMEDAVETTDPTEEVDAISSKSDVEVAGTEAGGAMTWIMSQDSEPFRQLRPRSGSPHPI
jgi:hypothetical protein